MKWMLLLTIVCSLLTISELYKEYKQGTLAKKVYMAVVVMESV